MDKLPYTLNLANTCPVDNWLVFLKAFSPEHQDTFKTFADLCSQTKPSLNKIVQLVQSSRFIDAKVLVAC